MFLAGAALIREREHGTIEHLLVMPLTPTEIMLAKIWANGLVIVVAAALSLRLVVQGWLGLSIAGSMALFVAGVVLYLFAIASLSIFLATLARSMSQFALLAFPLFIIMNLLSGGNTPAGQHGAVFTGGYAGLTVDAFCACGPGHPVPRCGLRHRVAGVRRNRGHWCRVLRRRPAAFSQSAHRDAMVTRTVVHGHALQARLDLRLLLSRECSL